MKSTKKTSPEPPPALALLWVGIAVAFVVLVTLMGVRLYERYTRSAVAFTVTDVTTVPTVNYDNYGRIYVAASSAYTSVEPTQLPCVVAKEDSLTEAYTARLLWFAVASNRRVRLERVSSLGESGGAISPSELYVDPCVLEYSRLATILHEFGHTFESPGMDGEQEQAFADEVAVQAGLTLGLYLRDKLPGRKRTPRVDAALTARKEEILTAARILARVAKGE